MEGAAREERSVSWRPGAEGAPRSGVSVLDVGVRVEESLEVVVLVVEVGWAAGGARRRDCVGSVRIDCWGV